MSNPATATDPAAGRLGCHVRRSHGLFRLFLAAAFCLLAGSASVARADDCARPDPGDEEVVLFEDDGFRGACARLRVDDTRPVLDFGMANDKVSSVRVGGLAQVVLCEHGDFGGECELFTEDDARLGDNAIGNDRVSSVRVQPRGRIDCLPGPDDVAIFMHRRYVAPCRIIRAAEVTAEGGCAGCHPSLETERFPNDSASSIIVGENVRAVLCSDVSYQGSCRLFRGRAARFDNDALGDNEASSAWLFPSTAFSLPSSIYVGRRNRSQSIAGDLDKDGLRDAYENTLAEQFKPVFKFDQGEAADVRRAEMGEPIVLFQVRPYDASGQENASAKLIIRWAFLFLRDGGYPSGSLCHDFNNGDSHNGDNDKATFILGTTNRGRTWELEQVHLSGPDDPQNFNGEIIWPLPQKSPKRKIYAGRLELKGLRHPYIYMSNGKHHMYLHGYDQQDSPYSDPKKDFILYTQELDPCPDDVDGDVADVIPNLRSVGLFREPREKRFNNVGEPEVAGDLTGVFVNDLTHLFPAAQCPTGRAAWSPEHFCSEDTPPNSGKWLSRAFIFKP